MDVLEETPSARGQGRDRGMGGVPMETRLREWWQESYFPDRRQAEVCGDLPTSALAQGSAQDPGGMTELLLNLGAPPPASVPCPGSEQEGKSPFSGLEKSIP